MSGRHAEPLTMERIDQELEQWAAAGFPIPTAADYQALGRELEERRLLTVGLTEQAQLIGYLAGADT